MKLLIIHTISFFISSATHAQNAVDFIVSYNKHIDPTGKLDTVKFLAMQIKSEIDYTLNVTTRHLQRTRNCNFYSDRTMKCVDVDSSDRKGFKMPPIPEEQKNAMKFQLNFILIDETDSFLFKLKNDSITIVEKVIDPSNKFVYTFDSNTKDLLQMKRVNVGTGDTYVSYTDFKSYQTINGIIVPKKTTFSNSFSTASLEYLDVKFE